MRHPIGLSRHDWLRLNEPLYVSERTLEPPDEPEEYDPAQAEDEADRKYEDMRCERG